jgi:hypothetical protein
VTNGTIGDHRFALDDLGKDIDALIGYLDANSLSDHTSLSTDGDELFVVVVDVDDDITREAQNACRSGDN